MADAIRAEMGVEFDLENVGGVRAPLVKGPITQAMLAEVDPFQNTVVTFRLTGAELKRILLADRPAVSGIEYEVAGGRLVRAEIGGAPIDDSRLYTGAANSFMAERSLKGARDLKDTGRGRRETLAAYIRKQGTVQPAYDGRRIIRGE
jgi:5'-nucleotidase